MTVKRLLLLPVLALNIINLNIKAQTIKTVLVNQENQVYQFYIEEKINEYDTVVWNFGEDCQTSPAYIPADCDIQVIGKQEIINAFHLPGIHIITVKYKGKTGNTMMEIKPASIPEKRTSGSSMILNGEFESNTHIPYKISQIEYASPWKSANKATPDYFHVLSKPSEVSNWTVKVPRNFAGYCTVSSGQAYAGILTYYQPDTSVVIGQNSDTNSSNYREYISQELNDTLIGGVQYTVRFKIKLSSRSRVKTPVGYLLSKTRVLENNNKVLPMTPYYEYSATVDTGSWTTISQTIVASGGERYIVIGNFQTDTSSQIKDTFPINYIQSNYGAIIAAIGYYYIEDVEVNPAIGGIIDPGGTLVVKIGEMVNLNAKTGKCMNNEQFKWTSDIGFKAIESQMSNKTIVFAPWENMTVYLDGFDGCNRIIRDSVIIKVLEPDVIAESSVISNINIYPNPVNSTFCIELYSKQSKQLKVMILTSEGKVYYQTKIQVSTGQNKLIIEKKLNSGIFMLILSDGDQVLYRQPIAKTE